MIYKVIATDQAGADLRGIYEYIAFEMLSPDNNAGIVTVIPVMYAGRDVDSQLKEHTVV
ncbi:MAG: hypothetical protein HFJ04_06070 [Lachnospiraceae bacterium]|nr:hypothetical protein [Lachnospiraceae bacterium]